MIAFGYGALTLYGLPFQAGSPNDQIFDFARIREDPKVDSYNPETATAPAYHAVAVWTVPFSLATTQGIDIFSSSYLDVSVRWLTFRWPMYSATDDWALPQPGFPIRTSSDHCLLATPPKLFAACHVLHRLLAPRHPPSALNNLTHQRRLIAAHGPSRDTP